MRNIYDLSITELENYFIEHGQKKFRATQVLEWLYRHLVTDFSAMSNLSQSVIDQLMTDFVIEPLTLATLKKASDGTIKYLFRLADGHLIETVLMRHNYGNSVCVSSQVGCAMKCAFCASGELGKVRNLELAEMIGQLMFIQNALKHEEPEERISNVVVMGIGEPFDNYVTLLKFLELANYPKGLEIGARHITVSTSGLVPKIRDFADFPFQINLAISLHAPTDELRDKLMPVNHRYPLVELMTAVNEYIELTNRRVTYEYILLSGVNDSLADADRLANLIRGQNVYVNLIPYNEVIANDFVRTSHEQAESFFARLRQRGINATLRTEHGGDIDAACGQLRSQKMKGDS